jgi:hypothetical protein
MRLPAHFFNSARRSAWSSVAEARLRQLCELLIHGAIVEDAESYEGLSKVHQDAGCDQSDEGQELAFEQIAERVEGGFQVAFTAFHCPQTMGAVSVVARYEFFVQTDATVKFKSRTYLRGMLLNWQTGMLESVGQQEKQAQALARVAKFVHDCYEHCSTRLPRVPGDTESP